MKPNKGFLLIDKSPGMGSFGVIYRLRKITGIKKIGHSGTLDPFASGLLICALGAYTRLNSYLECRNKCYEASILLGKSTDTGDTEGVVTETSEVDMSRLDPKNLTAAALALTELPIPAYSAVWVQGKRSYDLARAGKAVELPLRATRILDFEITSVPDANSPEPILSYRCCVSKGTYIRSLSQWIASQMGTVGHTISLRRSHVADIDVSDAVSLNDLNSENWQDYLIPPAIFFDQFPSLIASDQEINIMNNGQSIPNSGADTNELMVYDSASALVCVAYRNQDRLYPKVNLK